MNSYKNSIVGFVTVRASSSRLPNKCLLPFGKLRVLNHIIRRAIFYGIEPIICTSTDYSDNIIEKISKEEGVRCFRGSLQNKLKRWLDCAEYFNIDRFHTIDADDPFFDGEEMKKSIELLEKENLDMVCPTEVSSAGGASVGYSLTTSIVKRACKGLEDDADTEMMWHYIEKIPELKKTILKNLVKYDISARMTLDYHEDYIFLEAIRLILGNMASQEEIYQMLVNNTDLLSINSFRTEDWKNNQQIKLN
jgi:spore coat polysaccharide biosynthesis protein SpsF